MADRRCDVTQSGRCAMLRGTTSNGSTPRRGSWDHRAWGDHGNPGPSLAGNGQAHGAAGRRVRVMSRELTAVQRLKLEIFERGIAVDDLAKEKLTNGGREGLTHADYPTTGGLTLVLPEDVYVNAPVCPISCETPAAVLTATDDEGDFFLHAGDLRIRAIALPLPGYLKADELTRDGLMTHADRARISPVGGCSANCAFCDSPDVPYRLRPPDQLMSAFQLALDDERLPPRHVLVSGGTPRPWDREYLDGVYARIIRESPLPVDVMLAPRPDTNIIDWLVELGVFGFAINLELFNCKVAARLTPFKQGLGLEEFAHSIGRAVELTGGEGRVRSLLLVGLESVEDTLRGVRFLAELGCDPCLSPFRPAVGTVLANHPLPEASMMEDVYLASLEIAEQHGVRLGPRCIPCQHNTVAFPDDSSAFYYS